MKRSFAVAAVLGVLIAALSLPLAALGFQITGGGGTQTRNPYGLYYAGREACAREGCHSEIASKPSPHSTMVTDVKANPSQLSPAADSGLWPYVSISGGLTLRPRDMYLVLGDSRGKHEYVGAQGSALAANMLPADDLPLWDPLDFFITQGAWSPSKVIAKPYSQSCSGCHNVGFTRPSNATYTLGNGATQTTSTPSTVSEFGVQCESCHGSGKDSDPHKTGVPRVVSGTQILKAQVCGQCHVSGTTPQKNVNGSAFGNPNGYSTDTSLSAYLTPYTTVPSETAFMNYVNGVPGFAKPKFLPNGANFSMNHSYYNEWLVSSHANKPRASTTSNSNPRCKRCHSGLGFLYYIDAKSPSGTRLVATAPTSETVDSSDPSISCQVCHDGHVTYTASNTVDATRRWGNGKSVTCGDCHNWRFETLDYTMQYETIDGVEYTRPPLNQRSHPAAREMAAGGLGGDDALGGLWGVKPMGPSMPGVTCVDCHMPRTYREGGAVGDVGSTDLTRMSHTFHVTYPGDAQRWKLRPNGDSCAVGCHEGEAAEYTRADFQTWIDQKRTAVASASAETSSSLATVWAAQGFTRMRSLESTQPTTGPAATISPAKWTMLQHAAQNFDIIGGDGSGGLHNPAYALAGLAQANLWARSATATLDATLGTGLTLGTGMTASGKLLGVNGAVIPGAEIVLETSTDGSNWALVRSGKPDGSGAFSLLTGPIVGSRTFRVRFTPMAGVNYLSAPMVVEVPVTSAGVSPAGAVSAWFNIGSAQVTLTATPGSATFYTLTGATLCAKTLYTGPITIAAEGRTDVAFWSTSSTSAEATQTLPIFIDRAAPAVRSDRAPGYANKAVIHAWGTDAGSGVESVRATFRGASKQTAGSSLTFETYALGRNNLLLSATDGAGKTTTETVSVWVKATPALTMSPRWRKTISKGKSIKFATRATRGHDASGHDIMFTGRPLVLQRWDGRKWVSWKRFSSGKGSVSWTKKFAAKGTSYWRWRINSDAYSYPANSAVLKVVVH